ncbi:MAG: FkbM family methyltransferase [Planctomycetota bacterium]
MPRPRLRLPDRLPDRLAGRRRAVLKPPGLADTAFWVHGPRDRYVSECLLATGQMEPLETRVFCKLIRGSTGFLDIGANLGYYTVLAQNLGPAGMTCVAVEPEKLNLRLLRRNVRPASGRVGVDVVPAAASDRDGHTDLHLSPDNFGDHQTTPQPNRHRRSRRVATTTLARLLARRPEIDFIKIDIQGAEPQVLGNPEAIAAMDRLGPECSVVFEFWPHALDRSAAEKLAGLADTLGLHAFDIDEERRSVGRTDAEDLLGFYDLCRAGHASRPFTNVFCTRSPQRTAWLENNRRPLDSN